jgi:membrane protease YdiL (CAAX protease family)
MEIRKYAIYAAEGAALSIAAQLAEPVISRYLPIGAGNQDHLVRQLKRNPLKFMFKAAVKAPVEEEVRYRFIPQLYLDKIGMNNKAVMAVSSVYFAYSHNRVLRKGKVDIDFSTIPIIQGFMGSYLWQTVEDRGIVPAILIHAAMNATTSASILIGDYLRKRQARKNLQDLNSGAYYH